MTLFFIDFLLGPMLCTQEIHAQTFENERIATIIMGIGLYWVLTKFNEIMKVTSLT
jgi:hypothetical protein